MAKSSACLLAAVRVPREEEEEEGATGRQKGFSERLLNAGFRFKNWLNSVYSCNSKTPALSVFRERERD